MHVDLGEYFLVELLALSLGIVIGSFLNVCIYRLPQGQSIVTPPSHCYACNTRLKPWDLIPILSYLFLQGRCRYCGTEFSSRYMLIELLTGILFLWCFMIFGFTVELIKTLILTAFLIVITFIDYDHQLILDKVLIWFAATGVVINFWLGTTGVMDMLIAAVVGGVLLLIIAIVSRGGMGGGDIKFAASLGLWLGWHLTLLTLFLSFIIGGVGGILLLIFKLKGRKDFIPFGPFIAFGAFLSLLYGYQLLTWYLAWL